MLDMIETQGVFLLGILQGIMEWLPISSQGNLAIFIASFGGLSSRDIINLTVFLHLGTVLAALVFFREEIWSYLTSLRDYGFRDIYENENNRVLTFLIVSTLITGAFGFLLYSQFVHFLSIVEGKVFIALIGCFLIVTGAFQKLSSGTEQKDLGELSLSDSIVLGFAQSLSILPGISRSGTTVSALLLRDYDQKTSLKLSFIMSIPAVIGANLFLILSGEYIVLGIKEFLIAALTSFIIGYLALKFLLKVAKRLEFWIFCIMLGSIALFALFL